MATVQRFEDLEAWKEARKLNRVVYAHTKATAFSKDFALRDQIRRASISVMSNIAEGFERGGDKEFVQFLSIAKGSCGEVRSQLFVALDERYVSRPEFEAAYKQCMAVSRLLAGLLAYLHRSPKQGRRGFASTEVRENQRHGK
ncbi:MAG: four helix bundle protein [Planctomycetaceae bacterium]|nr:four helix bundle protein [Planctomycetaceae bacterium]